MSRPYRKGEEIKLTASLGNGDEDGETIAFKGDTGRVVSCNPEFKSKITGEPSVAVEIDGVGVAAVPKRAVTRDSGTKSFFLPRG